MLRAVLLGLLAVSATSSCRGSSDTPAVAPGAVAGQVLEASGSASATRNGATRPLAAGAEVFGDDVIDTANGSVVILLRHNNARWAIESGQRARVDESLAWRLAKQAGPVAAADHASSAAGREGERSAADTRSTSEGGRPSRMRGLGGDGAAESEAAPPAQAPRAVAASEVPVAPVAPATPAQARAPSETHDVDQAAGGGAGGGQAGGAETSRVQAAESKGGAASVPRGGKLPDAPDRSAPNAASAPSDPAQTDPAQPDPARNRSAQKGLATPEQQLLRALEARRGELQGCLGKLALTLVVRVDRGAPAIELTGGTAGAPIRACLERVVKQLPVAGLTATASIRLGG
jgi:hypothetical protein